MGLGDLISLIGIILAIIAFLDESERKLIINKFSYVDLIIIVLYFLFVNFLLFYESISTNYRDIFKHFEFENFPHPKTWAYIISVSFIAWILIKVFHSTFPDKNKLKVIVFYKNLIYRNEFYKIYNYFKSFNLRKINCPLGDEIITNVISNHDFLAATSHYNSGLIFDILKKSKSKNDKLIKGFISTQLEMPKSYVINNVVCIDEYFYELILKNEKDFSNAIKKSLLTNREKLGKISLLTLNYYAKKIQVSQELEFSIFENVMFKLFKKENLLEVEYFFIHYSTCLQNRNIRNELFEKTFKTIIYNLDKLISECNKETQICIINEFLNLIISLFNNGEHQQAFIEIFLNEFKPNQLIDLRTLIYEESIKRKDFKSDILNAIIYPLTDY